MAAASRSPRPQGRHGWHRPERRRAAGHARSRTSSHSSFASSEQVSDELLEDLWKQVARAAGCRHLPRKAQCEQRARRRRRTDAGRAVGRDAWLPRSRRSTSTWRNSSSHAPSSSDPNGRCARPWTRGWGDVVARALPYLQRAALTPHLRDLARTHEVDLKELRAAAATATGQEAPEIAPLRRVRPQGCRADGVRGRRGLPADHAARRDRVRHDRDELKQAELAWVVVALIVAQFALIGSAVSMRGTVSTPLALLPCAVLQSAIKFVNLTVPSSAGRIAMNLRFLQRMGVHTRTGRRRRASSTTCPRGSCRWRSSCWLSSSSERDVDTSEFRGAGPDSSTPGRDRRGAPRERGDVVLAVPKLHAKMVPDVRAAFADLWTRGPCAEQASRALRRQRRLRGALRDRARRHVPRLRPRPQPGRARLRQYVGLGPRRA